MARTASGLERLLLVLHFNSFVEPGIDSRPHRRQVPAPTLSAFTGFRFPPEVIMLAVRWYLRYGLSYRDLEELLVERGIDVDHVTLRRRR